eukprot:COSAG01_NODE_2142_length_8319_cov_19.391653_12_plen_83_part_00
MRPLAMSSAACKSSMRWRAAGPVMGASPNRSAAAAFSGGGGGGAAAAASLCGALACAGLLASPPCAGRGHALSSAMSSVLPS